MIAHPQSPFKGTHYTHPVELIDIYPTLNDLLLLSFNRSSSFAPSSADVRHGCMTGETCPPLQGKTLAPIVLGMKTYLDTYPQATSPASSSFSSSLPQSTDAVVEELHQQMQQQTEKQQREQHESRRRLQFEPQGTVEGATADVGGVIIEMDKSQFGTESRWEDAEEELALEVTDTSHSQVAPVTAESGLASGSSPSIPAIASSSAAVMDLHVVNGRPVYLNSFGLTQTLLCTNKTRLMTDPTHNGITLAAAIAMAGDGNTKRKKNKNKTGFRSAIIGGWFSCDRKVDSVDQLSVMGYSMRTKDFRYTAWLHYDMLQCKPFLEIDPFAEEVSCVFPIEIFSFVMCLM